MQRFLRDQQLCIALELGATADRFTQIHTISKQPAPRLATRDNHCFRLKYSVSHFIDCDAVARRLCVSLIASGNTADEMGKIKKHECNQT
jgi:hypothetical protein